MIDIKFLREHGDIAKRKLLDRGCNIDVDAIIKLDEKRREIETKKQGVVSQHKEVTRQIADIRRSHARQAELVRRENEILDELSDIHRKIEQLIDGS